MQAYQVTRWDELYEVDTNGRPWKDGASKRRGSLDYVRWQVHGRSMGAGYRRLQQVCGTAARFESTFAVWGKLLELAASNSDDLRGWILNEDHEPASVEDLVFFTGFRKSSIQNALKALAHPRVKWIELQDFAGAGACPRNSRESASVAEFRDPFLNETETEDNSEQHNENEKQGNADQRNAPQANDSDSAKKSFQDTSDSDSGLLAGAGGVVGRPITRPAARMRYHAAIERLFGASGPGQGRHPQGSPQWRADETCANAWWEEIIWPAGDPPDECRKRLDAAMRLIGQAASRDKPMAWLTRRVEAIATRGDP